MYDNTKKPTVSKPLGLAFSSLALFLAVFFVSVHSKVLPLSWSPTIISYFCVCSVFVFNALFDEKCLVLIVSTNLHNHKKLFITACLGLSLLLAIVLSIVEVYTLHLLFDVSLSVAHAGVTWHQVICFFLFGANTVLFGNKMLNTKPGLESVFSLYLLSWLIWVVSGPGIMNGSALGGAFDGNALSLLGSLLQTWIIIQLGCLTVFYSTIEEKTKNWSVSTRFAVTTFYIALIGTVLWTLSYLAASLAFKEATVTAKTGHVWSSLVSGWIPFMMLEKSNVKVTRSSLPLIIIGWILLMTAFYFIFHLAIHPFVFVFLGFSPEWISAPSFILNFGMGTIFWIISSFGMFIDIASAKQKKFTMEEMSSLTEEKEDDNGENMVELVIHSQ
ncbi:hypothetical protein RCL1_002297 [Eukaryota sp. TZLM3-RCL]